MSADVPPPAPGAEPPVVPVPWRTGTRPGPPLVLRRTVVVAPPAAGGVAARLQQRLGALERAGSTANEPATHGDAPSHGSPGDRASDAGPTTVELRLVQSRSAVGLPDGVAEALAEEGYRLDVGPEGAVVTALSPAGLRHGATTLVSLARVDGSVVVPAASVVDVPRFAWRGLHLDVARHFLGVDVVTAVLDVMADLKLNVLHLHLTDDQGWRLEIPSRPALTARSGATAVGGDPGGWYSVADYRRIVAAAADRGITVVPEIDVPGHVNAAQHACGELNPTGEPVPPYTGIDVGFSRLHADVPATGPFLRDVLGEVAAMTPGPWVHIGGDEAPALDHEEYGALVRSAADAVRAAGRSVVAWQEAATAGLPASSVLQYWDERTGAEHVVAAAAAGTGVVLSPAGRVYLDMRYDAATPIGLEWAGHVPLRRSYDWEPLDVLPGAPPDRVLGVEACLWTETVRDLDDVALLLLPRLAAVAEVAWSAADRRDWDGFSSRVRTLGPRWSEAGLAWFRAPEVDW